MPLSVAPTSAYERVRALVPSPDEAGHMALVHGVLDGLMPGRFFVDDAHAPRTVVSCGEHGFWFGLGEPNGELVRHGLPELRAAIGPYATELWATTDAWAEALNPLFAEHKSRNEYHFVGPNDTLRSQLPPGFELVPLDVAIARKFEGAVDPWVVNIWGGPERFASMAFGWAVMRGDELARFCTTCGLGGGEAEVEIVTNDRYRRLGLATVAGAAFVRTALEHGYRPAWTCSTGNTGSERLAEKLGFAEFRRITGYPMERAEPRIANPES
jgi:hypothetical protein